MLRKQNRSLNETYFASFLKSKQKGMEGCYPSNTSALKLFVLMTVHGSGMAQQSRLLKQKTLDLTHSKRKAKARRKRRRWKITV